MVRVKFEEYLNIVSKRNGGKLSLSTIERYNNILLTHKETLSKTKTFKELIESFNYIIKRSSNNICSSAFLYYISYIGGIVKKKSIEFNGKIYPLLDSFGDKPDKISSRKFLQEKVLSRGEIKILIERVDSENYLRQRMYCSVLYDTACRREEAVGSKLQPDREILVKDIIFLNTPLNGNIYAKVSLLGKGNKRREVYLTKTTCMLCLLWIKKNNLKPTDDLFYLRKKDSGKYERPDNELYKIIKKYGSIKLAKDIHPHCFRHTKATHLADFGASVLEIQKYLDHEDIKTTMRYISISTYVGKRGFSRGTVDIMEE